MRCFIWCITLGITAISVAADAQSLIDAHRLWRTGHYGEAREKYREASETSPVEAALGTAQCFLAQGDFDDARRALRRALNEQPNSAPLHAASAELAWQQGQYDAAHQHVAKALASDANCLHARWLQAELWRVEGQLQKAHAGYEWLVDYYNDTDRTLTSEESRWIGLAAAQFARWTRNHSQFHFLVNDFYPTVLKLDPTFWPAHLEIAHLLLEKYNLPDAQVELDRGLAINPNAADLYVERGRMALQEFQFDRADAALQQALQINPRSVRALQLVADSWLARQQYAPAFEALEKAREIHPRDEQTLGRLAAIYIAQDGWNKDPSDNRSARAVRDAEAHNPRCGEFYLALASTLDLLRRYPAAEYYYRETLERMPQLTEVRGHMGLMSLRLGDEHRAREHLRASFDIDPFNVRVKNSLEVLELLSEYAVLETDHFILRFDRGANSLFAECAAEYLEEEVYPEIVRSLNYQPRNKALFEFFSSSRNATGHNWFSARMVGLPYVGVIAACGGNVVGMVSPAEIPVPCNWADTLKHEFVHVVNLHQTDYNVPHWFTEGLAVWHENRPRPAEWQQLLAARWRAGRLFHLDDIYLGFTRPSEQEDWTLAYCQAELYVEFLIKRFGADAIQQLLAAYATPMTTGEALQHCFQTTQEEFEKDYLTYIERLTQEMDVPGQWREMSLERLRTEVEKDTAGADVWAELAARCAEQRLIAEASRWATAAVEAVADHPTAWYARARLELLQGNRAGARDALERSVAAEPADARAWYLLAKMLGADADRDATLRFYQRGARRFPHDATWPKMLAAQYLAMGDTTNLEASLAQLHRLDPSSSTICKKLSQLARDRSDPPAAIRWAREAVHMDCEDAQAHAMLGEALQQHGDHTRAVRWLERSLRVDGSSNDVRVRLAQSLLAIGDPASARQHLERVLAAQPDHAAALDMLRQLPENKQETVQAENPS